MKKKSILLALLLSGSQFALAQQNFWRTVNQKTIQTEIKVERAHTPTSSIKMSLNYDDLVNYLTNVSGKNTQIILKFPDTNNVLNDYIIEESSNFHPDLQAKYQTIRSYTGYNIANPSERINFSISPQFGLYGMISGTNGTILIDTYTKDKSTYLIYDKSNLVRKQNDFTCGVEEGEEGLGIDNLNLSDSVQQVQIQSKVNDSKLRTFRLAITTTTEYSNYIIQQANITNGTESEKLAAILAAVNLSMTRINGILRNDVGAFFQLISDTDKLFFITTDTFDANDAEQMIEENTIVVNNIIGSANYDIGHLFFKVNSASASNGLAYTPSVCINSVKAGGVTGTVVPVGDPFDIDFTAHEMGHQLGARHTQNNACNRDTTASAEPGSGSTIMAYTGICTPNVQKNSDPYYMSISIAQMNNILKNVSCGTITTTSNSAPTITIEKSLYTIPHSTPFILDAKGDDIDGDDLTYNWEQTDKTVGEKMPPVSGNKLGPMFRSWPSKKESYRYFPRLEKILENKIVFVTNSYSGSTNQLPNNNWEVVPSVARYLNFSVVVRDNNSSVGQTASSNIRLSISEAAGPFKVSSQDTGDYWAYNQPASITWDVAGTDANGIDTQNVKILLSVDGGKNFDYILAETAPNNGKYDFTVPSDIKLTKEARIMIKAIDNVFLAVNAANFEISDKLAISDITTKDLASISPNPSNGMINLDFSKSFTTGKITVTDLAGRTVYSNNLNSSKSQQVNLTSLTNGVYIISIETGNEQFTKKIIIKK